jgi:hypothetical protein
MKYISKILLSLSIATIGLVAQPVCSNKVVSELTSNATFASHDSIGDESYIIKIHSVEGSIVKAWVLTIYSSAGRKDWAKKFPEYSKLGYAKDLWAYDFSNDTSALLSLVKYNCNGEVIASDSRPYASYDVVVPDSAGEAKMQTVKEMVNQ